MPYVTIDGPVYERSNARRGVRSLLLAGAIVCTAIAIVVFILP